MSKKICLLLVIILLIPLYVLSQDNIKLSNTIKIEPEDSEEVIVAKAAHVVPTTNQLEALKNEFIAFIHIGPFTFTRKEWGCSHMIATKIEGESKCLSVAELDFL